MQNTWYKHLKIKLLIAQLILLILFHCIAYHKCTFKNKYLKKIRSILEMLPFQNVSSTIFIQTKYAVSGLVKSNLQHSKLSIGTVSNINHHSFICCSVYVQIHIFIVTAHSGWQVNVFNKCNSSTRLFNKCNLSTRLIYKKHKMTEITFALIMSKVILILFKWM